MIVFLLYYIVQALHRILEKRNHGVPWPARTLYAPDILNAILRRVNEASDLYQMFTILGDIILLREYVIRKISKYTRIMRDRILKLFILKWLVKHIFSRKYLQYCYAYLYVYINMNFCKLFS